VLEIVRQGVTGRSDGATSDSAAIAMTQAIRRDGTVGRVVMRSARGVMNALIAHVYASPATKLWWRR